MSADLEARLEEIVRASPSLMQVLERARAVEQEGGSHEGRRRLRLEMIAAERRMLIRLRNEDAISDEVLRELEQELDLESVRAGAGDR